MDGEAEKVFEECVEDLVSEDYLEAEKEKVLERYEIR